MDSVDSHLEMISYVRNQHNSPKYPTRLIMRLALEREYALSGKLQGLVHNSLKRKPRWEFQVHSSLESNLAGDGTSVRTSVKGKVTDRL